MVHKLANRYVSRVSRRMPVGGSMKKQFLGKLQEDVLQYLETEPAATLALLEVRFGSPDDIAADFISQMSYREINNKFRARNRIVAAVIVAAILIVGIWGIAVSVVSKDAQNGTHGYVETRGPIILPEG